MIDGARRVQQLVEAARRIADPKDPLGREAVSLLPASTGLSPQGVELALRDCLEHGAEREEIDALVASVPTAPRAHVILARTVFTAPLRAIALGLAQTPDVSVRPSRHEPHFSRLLLEAKPGLFRLVDDIDPGPKDHVWLYGQRETESELRRTLPAGSWLHAHGPGFGVAVIEAGMDATAAARALAGDVVPFDQRGCLSPRLAIWVGPEASARALAQELALALGQAERRTPLGFLSPDEAGDVVRYRDTLAFAGEILEAGRGFVSFGQPAMPAPVGRNLHVFAGEDLEAVLAPHKASIAAVGVMASPALAKQVTLLLPNARASALGSMQRPRFDGAVDLRAATAGEVVRAG